jgi:flagellar biosynthesis/type III secretory pathway protein FliH
MSTSHLFQDFGTEQPIKTGRTAMAVEEIEDLKLQAFENGYQAGWDDAVKAQSNTRTHVASGLASSLQSASFEYHELRATLNASVRGIMMQMAETILPMIAKASLGAHIQERITEATRDALDRPIEIAIAPESEEAVRAVLSDKVPDPFVLVPDPLMDSTQAILRLGSRETEINLDRVMVDIGTAITTFFETHNSEVNDG